MAEFKITHVNEEEDSFTVTNVGSEAGGLDGYTVHDQKVEDGTAKRNQFDFTKKAAGLTLAAGATVTVYSGPGSKTREYDGATTVQWFSYKVWSGDLKAYLVSPDGNKTTYESEPSTTEEATTKTEETAAETAAESKPEEAAETAAEPAKEEKPAEPEEPEPEMFDGPSILISSVSSPDGSFVVWNTSSTESVSVEGWKVAASEDVSYTFGDLTIEPDQRVTVYSGKEKKEGEEEETTTEIEYDGVTKIKWTDDVVWANPVTATLTSPEGETAQTYPCTEMDRGKSRKLVGTCKFFNATKGFGFIHEVSDGGPEVFVHSSEIKAEEVPCLVAGQRVEFVWTEDKREEKKAMGRASKVTGAGGALLRSHISERTPNYAKRLQNNPDVLMGTCKWFDTKKGYGFIVPWAGGPDVFMHQSNITWLGAKLAPIAIGQALEYKLQLKEEEKEGEGEGEEAEPKAEAEAEAEAEPKTEAVEAEAEPKTEAAAETETQAETEGDEAKAKKTAHRVTGVAITGPGGLPITPMQPTMRASAVGAGEKRGTIKWYNSQKGYGFVTDAGNDIFLHSSGIDPRNPAPLQPGTPVAYTTETKEGDKQARAVRVRAIGVAINPMAMGAGHLLGGNSALLGKRSRGMQPQAQMPYHGAPKFQRTQAPLMQVPGLAQGVLGAYRRPPMHGIPMQQYGRYPTGPRFARR